MDVNSFSEFSDDFHDSVLRSTQDQNVVPMPWMLPSKTEMNGYSFSRKCVRTFAMLINLVTCCGARPTQEFQKILHLDKLQTCQQNLNIDSNVHARNFEQPQKKFAPVEKLAGEKNYYKGSTNLASINPIYNQSKKRVEQNSDSIHGGHAFTNPRILRSRIRHSLELKMVK